VFPERRNTPENPDRLELLMHAKGQLRLRFRRVHELSFKSGAALVISIAGCCSLLPLVFALDSAQPTASDLGPFFKAPKEYQGDFGKYSSLLVFNNGQRVQSAADWPKRRAEIRDYWTKRMGPWPAIIEKPRIDLLEEAERDGFMQRRVRVEVAPGQSSEAYLLLPKGKGPFPAVFIPYYEPETSVGLKEPLRDFGYQLTRRGFVTLSIGSPGGDARKPATGEATCQPLSFLAYVAANCFNALAELPEVDPKRIGIVGHSYGGKWAMFGAALYDRFACGVWSDPGIVFDEKRSNVNYWEPWYLGEDSNQTRKPGVVTPESPRTGAYRAMVEEGHDLHEIMALMAPRPFLVSGGSEDQPERWKPLNRVIEVYQLLGAPNRVGMTNRPNHTPTPESNEQIYSFFEAVLKK
jgi:hypothetical protein